MPYDVQKDPFRYAVTSRDGNAAQVVPLTDSMMSDTVDLATYAKSLRVSNRTGSSISIKILPVRNDDAAPITIDIPSGSPGYEPISIRRIFRTGSEGLVSALAAGTANIHLLVE